MYTELPSARFPVWAVTLVVTLLFACDSRARKAGEDGAPDAPPAPHALLNRSVKATASSGSASAAQDEVFASFAPDHMWKCKADCWLAYDLSRVPEQARSALYVVLFFGGNVQYQINVHALGGVDLRGVPVSGYELQGAPSADGPWTTLLTVPSLAQASRVHLLEFRGHRVLRYRSAAATNLKMDVYSAADGSPPGLLLVGDSIANIELLGLPQSWFSRGVAARKPGRYPPIVGGGVSFTTAMDGRDLIVNGAGNFAKDMGGSLLDIYQPVTHLALTFGTNDAAPGPNANDAAFYQAYLDIVRAALARKVIVAIATPTWAADPNRQIGIKLLAGRIGLHPDVVPDWSPRSYRLFDHVWRGGKVYRCSTPGTSVNGPSGTGAKVSDGGSARWDYVPSLRESFASEVAQGRVLAGPDLYTLFAAKPDWLADGIHPNGRGSAEWQKAWVDWALAHLPP